MRHFMTILLGISLLTAPAMFGAAKKGGGSKEKEKSPDAAKAKIAKAKTQSAADQKAQK